MDPEPPAEQVRAAQDASRQRQLAKQAQRDSQAETTPESDDPNPSNAKICIDAKLVIYTLERALPVYFDEAGNLHHSRSKHSATYQGERHYLDDADRQTELVRARQIISLHCGESKADIIQQSDELKSRIRENVCADYKAEAERMIRSRESGSSDRARQLIEYCESKKDP
jgi:hypothetical protein